MTENAYLTNDVFDNDIVELLCKNIRNMTVIRDHPNWWVVVYLDGFSAHVDTFAGQLMFTKYKIIVLKENSNSSQINQAFDRLPAKSAKEAMGTMLSLYRCHNLGKMDQYTLLALLLAAESCITPALWTQSFKDVNLHPEFQRTAAEFCQISRVQTAITSGEASQPSVNLSYQQIVQKSEPIFLQSMTSQTKTNVLEYAKFFLLTNALGMMKL